MAVSFPATALTNAVMEQSVNMVASKEGDMLQTKQVREIIQGFQRWPGQKSDKT